MEPGNPFYYYRDHQITVPSYDLLFCLFDSTSTGLVRITDGISRKRGTTIIEKAGRKEKSRLEISR